MSSPAPQPPEPVFDWEACIQAARAGSASALGRLLEVCRPHLLALAERELDADLRAKASPSDLVQETCLDGFRGFPRFIGQTEGEAAGVAVPRPAQQRRRPPRTLPRGRQAPGEPGAVARPGGRGSSAGAGRRYAVAQLPRPPPRGGGARRGGAGGAAGGAAPGDSLRDRKHLSFAEVARAMNRSEDAVQKLWRGRSENSVMCLGSEGP